MSKAKKQPQWKIEHGALTLGTMKGNTAVRRFCEQLSKEPLAVRQGMREEWRYSITSEPETVAERVGWLLAGNYSQESYSAAWAVLAGRGNHVAALGIMIAALEWQCPPAFARGAWRSLTPEQQERVNAAIQGAINSAIQAREEEEAA